MTKEQALKDIKSAFVELDYFIKSHNEIEQPDGNIADYQTLAEAYQALNWLEMNLGNDK